MRNLTRLPLIWIVMTSACAQSFGRRHPIQDAARWDAIALAQRCPLPGLNLRAIRRYWGRPDSISPGSTGEIWFYHVKPGVRLAVSTRDSAILDWNVYDSVTAAIALPEAAWSLKRREGFPARVTTYLDGAHAAPPQVRYALYRSCPWPGMTEREVIASWGEPSRRSSSSESGLVTLIYGFGVEGQHDVMTFHNDSLVSVDYVN